MWCLLCGDMLAASPAELAQQVGRVVRALSAAGLRVRSAVMTGGQSEADRRSKTFRTQVRYFSYAVLVGIGHFALSNWIVYSACM
jgi:hypothetical protein